MAFIITHRSPRIIIIIIIIIFALRDKKNYLYTLQARDKRVIFSNGRSDKGIWSIWNGEYKVNILDSH